MTKAYRSRITSKEIALVQVTKKSPDAEATFDVERNRRSLLHVPADEDFARAQIRRVKLPNEKVVLIDLDGNRTDITSQFKARR